MPFQSENLFQPLQVGDINTSHRVVLAPLTRLRNTKTGAPTSSSVEYYSQRASTPGTLLIAEGTLVAEKAAAFPNVPGIYNDEQITAWKKVVEAVHSRGSYIYLQLFAFGRGAFDLAYLQANDLQHAYVAPSAIPLTGVSAAPRPLEIYEIHEYRDFFVEAAKNGIDKAGFDGVEVHLANGYLLNQFLEIQSNQRTDEYGGSVENRVRFPLEVIDAVVKAVGANKTSVRISPWSTYQDMRMPDIPLKETYSYLVKRLREQHSDLAFLHVVEPRIAGANTVETTSELSPESNDFISDLWSPRPLVRAGNFNRESAIQLTERHSNTLVAFGRHFISNPDLPKRLREDTPLTAYNRNTFYTPGDEGYIDYPVAVA